jgi:hypothetical protein
MAAVAALAGVVGRILAATGAVVVMGPMAGRIPADRHADFLTDLWIHNGSYAGGFVGGIVLAVRTWRLRRRGWIPAVGGPGDPAAPAGRGQGIAALVLGLLVILAGIAQTGADEEFLPRFHFPLLNVAFGIPAAALGLLALGARGRSPRAGPLLRNAGTAAAAFLLAALSVQGLAENVVAERRYDMTWSPGTYRLRSGDRTSVRLEFADHPGWATDIESKELADHLSSLGNPRVPVVIRTVRDFGVLRRFKVVRVADRDEWTYNDHGGWTGNCGWMRALAPLREGIGTPPIR